MTSIQDGNSACASVAYRLSEVCAIYPITPRSAMAERANQLISEVWARGWDEKPSLEPEYLWRAGSKGYAPEDENSIRSEEDVANWMKVALAQWDMVVGDISGNTARIIEGTARSMGIEVV